MALLLFKVQWMASCGGVCNGELQSYYFDIVINSMEFKLVLVLVVNVDNYTVYCKQINLVSYVCHWTEISGKFGGLLR
jgi:hypothetical protein